MHGRRVLRASHIAAHLLRRPLPSFRSVGYAIGEPISTNGAGGATAIKGMTIADGVATCERAVGTMREVYRVRLPAVVTVKDGLNIPRYPSVPGRIKARK